MLPMAGMDNSNSNGCKQCVGHMGAKAMLCAPVCVASLVNEQAAALPQFQQQEILFSASEIWRKGQSPIPDPYPPRTSYIG